MPDPKRPSWKMDTTTFSALYAKHTLVENATNDQYRLFVLDCYHTFVSSNSKFAYKDDGSWAKADPRKSKDPDTAIFQFLKERVYSKMMGVRSKLKDKKQRVPDPVKGYLTRNGDKDAGGTDWTAISGLFFPTD